MSFSIYDLDEDIRKLLNLENFLEGLSVNDFVEELSKDHFLKGAEVNKLEYLDPKPYIRTFESTLRELKNLSTEADRQRKKAEEDVEAYELRHSENVMQLSSKIGGITKKFDSLDSIISQVSLKIDPLGKSLNNISNSRDRSTETIFLIRAYHGFYTKEKYDPLENLRASSSYEDKLSCAKTVSNLLTLARKIESPDLPKTTKSVNNIEKFGESMERNLLNKFEVAYEVNEFHIMKEIANILEHYNGGSSVIQTFVSKNDLLLEADAQENQEEGSLLDDESAWSQLSDPDYHKSIQDASTRNTLDRLRVSIKGQTRIIQVVFQDPIPVLKILIQRVYAQMIQNKVSPLLQYSLSVSSLAHVRVLHSLYALVGDFTKDVKEFLTTNEFDRDSEVSTILDQSYFDLFIEYVSDDSYFNREKKNLEDTIYGIVQKFNHYNEKALANRSLSTKVENLGNIEYSDKLGADSVDRYSLHSHERKRLNQFKTFMKSQFADKNRNSTEMERTSDIDRGEYSTLKITKVETVLKSSIESIARVLEISPTRAPDNSLEILEILLFDFGKLYIEAGLEVSYDQLKQENVNSKINSLLPFDFTFLDYFNLVGEILFLVSSCVKKIILPCAVNTPNIKNKMSNLTNSYVARCEQSLNIILDECIEMISLRLNVLLGKQKKKDFLCDNITEDDTEACELISEFLVTVHDSLAIHLTAKNLKNVLFKIGVVFLRQLLEHFKKYTVNSTGGLILTKDVIRYQSIVDEWGISELSENYQLLKEISNLFTVHPNLINSLVAEGQLASLKPFTIRQYVSKRTDFNPSYIERFFSFKH